MSDVLLRADGVSKTFGRGRARVRAVTDATIHLHAGELVMLRGPSGSGKTTLLNVLGGLEVPSAGRVVIGDIELTGAPEAVLVELRRRRLGFVFQSFALLPTLTAAENIEVPLRLVGTPPVERDARVRELLDAVGLADHARQTPAQLSGGQQQRVGIARALANGPDVLIADEPTGQLDSRTGEAMMTLIASLVHARRFAAIVTTHDPRMTAFADRTIEISDGRLRDGEAT